MCTAVVSVVKRDSSVRSVTTEKSFTPLKTFLQAGTVIKLTFDSPNISLWILSLMTSFLNNCVLDLTNSHSCAAAQDSWPREATGLEVDGKNYFPKHCKFQNNCLRWEDSPVESHHVIYLKFSEFAKYLKILNGFSGVITGIFPVPDVIGPMMYWDCIL